MKQKIIQIGNSFGLIIPGNIRKEIGLKKGSEVSIEITTDKNAAFISKAGSNKKASTITPRFIKILDGVNKRYGPALAKLARQ